jgi:hypothetical protein
MSATLAYVCYTVRKVQLYYLSERTFDGGPPYVHAKGQQRTFALKDKSIGPPTLAYVRIKR